VEIASAEDVHVDVKHCLPGTRVAVEDGPVAALRVTVFFRDRCGETRHLSDERIVFGGQIVERRDMPSRNYQYVHRRLRVDVAEGHQPIVLMDERAGDFTCDDSAEKTIGHSFLKQP
jgi:hypothetical protein